MALPKKGKTPPHAGASEAGNLLLAAFDVLEPGTKLRRRLLAFCTDPERVSSVKHPWAAMNAVREELARLLAADQQDDSDEHSKIVLSTAFPAGRSSTLRPVEDQPLSRLLRNGGWFTDDHRAKWTERLALGDLAAVHAAIERAIATYVERTPPGFPVRTRIEQVRERLSKVADHLADVVRLLSPDPIGTPMQQIQEADLAMVKLVRWAFPTPRHDELAGRLIPASDVGTVISKLPRIAAGARLALADPDLQSLGTPSPTGPLDDTEAFDALVCALADIFESLSLGDATSPTDQHSAFVGFVETVLSTCGEALPEYPLLVRAPTTLRKHVQRALAKRREERRE